MQTIEVKFILWSLAAFACAGIIAFASTPLVKILAQKVGAIDVPKDSRRMHKVPIPRMGGLAIFLGFLFSVLIFVDITPQLQGILIGAIVIVILGIVDDIIPLPALLKFVVQILAALIVVYHGTRITMFSNPNIFSDTPYINLGVWSIPITVLWIVAITNAVNLIDGLDGLAVGVSSIASCSLFVIAIIVPEHTIALLMAALAGACIGFMPYNLNPAKIFMGDTGSTFLGFILASVSIQGLFKFYAVISFAVPFLILGLPIFDTMFAIGRRLLHGQNPMTADRGHVHHRLIDMGFNQKQSVTILYLMSGLLGLSAVVLTSSGEIKALFLVLAVILAIVIGTKIFMDLSTSNKQTESPSGDGSKESKDANPTETSQDSTTNKKDSELDTSPKEDIPSDTKES